MLDFSEFDILLKNLEEHKNIFCFYRILFSNVYVRMNKVFLKIINYLGGQIQGGKL